MGARVCQAEMDEMDEMGRWGCRGRRARWALLVRNAGNWDLPMPVLVA